MSKDYHSLVTHYEGCLERHGDNHLGVDWPNQKDAETRYRVMLDLIRLRPNGRTLLDFGCGASHLFEFMSRQGVAIERYIGVDLSPKFIALSEEKFPDNEYLCLDVLEAEEKLPVSDYTVANGVFTERVEMSDEQMWSFVRKTVAALYRRVKIGVAFNAMSSHTDWQRQDLFHLPLDKLAAFLVRHVTRDFIIRNDYGLYEYTVYLFKGAP